MTPDRGRERRFAGEPRANRALGEAIEAKGAQPARRWPGRSTASGSLDPAPIDDARAFATQLEIASRQLAALEAANRAGDPHASGIAASSLRMALCIAEQAVARLRVASEEHVAALERRLANVREAAHPALELAFTPSPAARREAATGAGRAQWDREVAAWRAARGRALEAAPSASASPALAPNASPLRAATEDATGAGSLLIGASAAGSSRLATQRKEPPSAPRLSGDHEQVLVAALRLYVPDGDRVRAWERFDRFLSWLPRLSSADQRMLRMRLEAPAGHDELARLFHQVLSASWQTRALEYLRSGHTAATPAQTGSKGPWEHMFAGASTPVNKLGRVQAPSGRTLRQGPSPDSAPSMPAPLPFDAHVMVVRRTTQPTANERWCYVTALDRSAAGFCEERYLAIDPPEPHARLHRVGAGETLGKIVRDAYGQHVAAGNDERLYVQGLYEANKDRAGVKLTAVQLAWSQTWHRREAEEQTLAIYRGVQVLEGMSLWIPSNDFLQRLKASGAITSGSSELAKAWRAAANVADDAIEAVKYAAGFLIGLLEGAWSAIVDLFQGAADMVEAIARTLYHLVTGNPGRIADMLMRWADHMKSAWEQRAELADGFMKQWNAPRGWDRGRFQGEVLGWVMMTVLILIATAGPAAAAGAGSLATRFPQVVTLLKTVDAVGDVTTYLGGAVKSLKAAGRLPEAAADIVKGKLGKAHGGAGATRTGSRMDGTSAPPPGPGAAHVHDEAFSANRTYEASPKHAGSDRKVGSRKVAKEPTDGATALKLSFQVSPRSPRRVGIDPKNNEFVVFDRTGNKILNKQVVGGVYHGHVRTWDELDDAMKRVLIEQGVTEKGSIKIDPFRWDLSP